MLFWVPCAIPTHTQGLTRWLEHSLTVSSVCLMPDRFCTKLEVTWVMGEEKAAGLQGVMFRGSVLGRTQMRGRDGQGTALKAGKGWDALCAILCDTRFTPGPFICLKHCRSRHKATPSRFVCVSYFPRKKKWSSNVYWQSWEDKKYGQISDSITAPFCILVLLNQQHCPKPPVSWGMMLFKLGYCAKTSPLCLDFEPMS